MITLKDWMEAVNFRITEGGDYSWQCYGPNAHDLSFWDGDHEGVSTSIVFDTKTQEVYESSVYDYEAERAYRLINPNYAGAYKAEAVQRSEFRDTAWDDVKFTELEVDEDFLEKLVAIINYEEYDTRVSIPIELPDNELLVLMKIAHERDITFNELIEEVLRKALSDFESDPEDFKNRVKEFIDE